jgi:alkylation response protein AidB-like acyl-CoA dehydrogenase
MEFTLSDVQQSWQSKAQSLGRELVEEAVAADAVMGAARVGLVDPRVDLLAAAVAVEALACESAAAAIALALHTAVVHGLGADDRFSSLVRGETVGAIALSTEEMPAEEGGGRVTGRTSWMGPLTDHGVAIVGTRSGGALAACAIALDLPGVAVETMPTAGLRGFVCGRVTFSAVESVPLGATLPFMARARILLAAAGLGMGRRALRDALRAAHGHRGRGAGGEQTVQGLLADAATELDAAMLLTWKAASSPRLSLAEASMAKLASTEATQRAVARATQVVGADSFRRGHVIARLAQDVRALELFAGRTEALREAVADEILPRVAAPTGLGGRPVE